MRTPADVHSPLTSSRRAKARQLVLGSLERAGFRLERLEDTDTFHADGRSTLMPEVMQRANAVPGMVSMRRGLAYYWLAYAGVPGDIIELGCWQGRSTSFFAQACRDSGNGVVHAVDTFGGNPGHEHQYKVGEDDLSDLERNFRRNIDRLGLTEQVRVYAGRSEDAAPDVLASVGDVRMLAVDAEHTYEAVSQELALYADALSVGGLLVFDDYSKHMAGVAQAVNEHIDAHPGRYATPVQDQNLLVVRRVR